MSVEALVQFVVNGILNSVWIAVLMVLVTWTSLRVLLKTNAATRHVLWWAVLALILLLPFRGSDQLRVSRATAPARGAVSVSAAASRPASQPAAVLPTRPVRPAPQPIFPIQLNLLRWLPALAILWAVFCLVSLVRIAVSFFYILSIRRRSEPAAPQLCDVLRGWMRACDIRRPVRLLVSRQITSPLATGFLRPAIILPAELAPQLEGRELDHVLLHELAHVARRDDWTNLAALTLAAIFGLHPVAAWVLRRVEHERELACDDWVVSMTGDARPYAASLARIFELCRHRRRMMLAPGMAGSGSRLGQRIDTLLDRGREFSRGTSLLVVASTVMVLAVVAGVFAFRAPRLFLLSRSRPISMRRTQPARFVSQRVLVRPAVQPMVFMAPPPQPSFLAALVAAGYGNLAVEDIITLKSNGVNAWYLDGLAKAKCPHMSVADIVALVHSRVSVDYLSKVQNAGFQRLTIQDVVNLFANHVRPEAIGEIHSLGFGPYAVASVIEFQRRGIGPGFFRSLRDAGFKQVDANGVIDAFTRGVRPNTLREVQQYKPNLTLDQVARLKQANVLQ